MLTLKHFQNRAVRGQGKSGRLCIVRDCCSDSQRVFDRQATTTCKVKQTRCDLCVDVCTRRDKKLGFPDKKLGFSFFLLLVWVVNLVRVFKVPCNKNFLFWHYWFLYQEWKSHTHMVVDRQFSILCFPEGDVTMENCESWSRDQLKFIKKNYGVVQYRR